MDTLHKLKNTKCTTLYFEKSAHAAELETFNCSVESAGNKQVR